MDRRKFLRNTSLAGVAIPSLAAGTVRGTSSSTQAPADDFLLNEATIDALQKGMQSGMYTSKKITSLYLQRIQEIDKKGPSINAVIELNPHAISIAEEMDKERSAGHIRGPLHGIPVLIKDNIDTGDKMKTSAGSLALANHHAKSDAFIVKLLRDAGAVLLGKTNLSEWANFRSDRAASGWSSRGGQTRNPYMLNRNPSGSSSGSAVAVAANMCMVAIGTETDGSIISPSSCCGIVGIKPTVGLLSRQGIIPISKTQDTAGPMARTVTDAAIFLSILAGIDDNDPVTLESHEHARKDYSRFVDEQGLKDKKIGIQSSFLHGHEDVVKLFEDAIGTMKSKGATIVEVDLLKLLNDLGEAENNVLLYEFKDGVNNYLAAANAHVSTLAELIEFNNKNASRVMPFFKQENLVRSEAKGGLSSNEYIDSLAKSTGARKIIDEVMKKYSLDAICATTAGVPGCIDIVNGDYSTGFYFGSPAAMAGYPHITVPMGTVHELPVGLSFIAGAYREPELIAMAYAYEQASMKRKSPRFLPDVTTAREPDLQKM